MAGIALKAVRDNLAGIMARPVLSRRGAAALQAPWRSVVNHRPVAGGAGMATPNAQVEAVLASIRQLVNRCHDDNQAASFDRILIGAMSHDRADHRQALDRAFQAAVDTRRHRVWSLVRVTAERSLGDRCRTCPPTQRDAWDDERVTALCADAACALLVADVAPATTLGVILEPLGGLVRMPHSGA